MARAERVVLIDGTWLVFRAFFALPANLSTATGLHTNAIYGFATMFRKLLQGRRPELGAVVFDAPGPTHRDEKFAAYKAQRPPAPRDLSEQFPWIERLVRTHGFRILRVPGYEADDVIGTLAREAVDQGHEVVITAGDKDFAQLVTDRVKLFDPMKDVTYDAALVQKKWGVRPEQIVDLLALLGDTVDNIPGVAGIGQKGACALLEQYGSVPGLYEHLDELKGKQRQVLEEQREQAFLSRELATIVTDAPLDVHVADLAIPSPDPEALDALYRELEFFSLLQGDAHEAPPDAVPVVVGEAEVRERLMGLGSGPVGVVPLVDPPTPETDGLCGLALSAGEGTAFYLPFAGDGPHLDDGAARAVAEWLANDVPKAAHDVKQLWKALSRRRTAGGPPPRGAGPGGPDSGPRRPGAADWVDTMLASFLVDPARCMPHRLDQVVKEYLQRTVRPLKSLVGSGQKERRIAELPVEEAAAFAGHWADAVAALAPVLRQRLDEEGQARHYREVELPLAFVLGRMELDGIRVDEPDLAAMGTEFEERKAAIEQRIYELAGHPFNVGSPQQLATVLFEELGLPVIKRTKTGYSTDAEVLERLAPKHEIAKLLLEQRMLAKLINTYTDVLRSAVSPIDHRIHASFQQTVGVSGRLISTDPDLQRTPVRTPEGKRIRKAFVADPGFVLLSADWSQIELRVLAHFSRDERLLQAFRDGLDVHRRTASELFHVPFEAVTPEQRDVGKTINFATIYGQGATALGQIMGIPRKEAAGYIERYFETYAGVRAWLDRTIAEAGVHGYVTTLLGRRRNIPELSSRSPMERQAGERIAANTPIQGSAADLCKLAMLKIARGLAERGSGAKLLLQVHDELVLEVPTDEVEEVRALVREAMEHPWPLEVPLVVNVGVGRSWADAH